MLDTDHELDYIKLHNEGRQSVTRQLMELLYQRRWPEFLAGLDSLSSRELTQLLEPDNSALLPYSVGCQLRNEATLTMPDELPVTPMLELMVTCNVDVVSRVIDVVPSEINLQTTLFQLVDFCCCEGTTDEAERKLADFYSRLAAQRPQLCVSLLNQEATVERLSPVEYAALWKKYHLARAYLETPGFICTSICKQRLTEDQFQLTQYHWKSGDRFLKSPFLYFSIATFGCSGEQIPSSFISFYNSPVTQVYLEAFREQVPKFRHAVWQMVMLLVCYFLSITTLTVRVFTAGTFKRESIANVTGYNDTSLVYLTELPEAAFEVFRWLFYLRISLQFFGVVACAVYLASTMYSNRLLPKPIRRHWLPLQWLRSFLTIDSAAESLVIGGFLLHLSQIIIEGTVIYSDTCYTTVNGQLFISAVALKSIYSSCLVILQHSLVLIVGCLSFYFEIFTHIFIALQHGIRIIYIGFFPVVMLALFVMVSFPFIPEGDTYVSLAADYVVAAGRFIFGQSDFVGPGGPYLMWVQPIYYVFFGIFLLNFCVAIITQRIGEVDQNIAFRQNMHLLGYWHLSCHAVYSIRRRFGILHPRREFVVKAERLRNESSKRKET